MIKKKHWKIVKINTEKNTKKILKNFLLELRFGICKTFSQKGYTRSKIVKYLVLNKTIFDFVSLFCENVPTRNFSVGFFSVKFLFDWIPVHIIYNVQ